jgi:hypothetical protein
MNIDISQLSSAIIASTAFIGTIGGIVGIWWRLNVAIQKIRDELGAYKTEVAEKYASHSAMRETEGRIFDRFDALTVRLDTLITMQKTSAR